MLHYARWKYIVALLVLLASSLYALPNIFPQDPSVQVSATRGTVVDEALKERVQGLLEQANLTFKSVSIDGNRLLVRTGNAEQQTKAADLLRPALGDGYVTALNLASTVPDWMRTIYAKPMSLGLDLQGGVHFLMEIDTQALLEKRENALTDEIRALLRENDIGYRSVDRVADGISIQLVDPTQATAAGALIARSMPQLALDPEAVNGVLSARMRPEELTRVLDAAIDQNISTLRNRISDLGEPIMQRQGRNRIVVQLPGVQDTALAKKLLGATATLEYRAVMEGDALGAANGGPVPPDARLYYTRAREGAPRTPVLLSKRVIASGDQLVDAASGYNPEDGSPMVSVKLDSVGGQRMFDFTRENVGKGMAVVMIERIPETRVVDGKEERSVRIVEEVISVATIQSVFSRAFQTTGLDSIGEAQELAKLLSAGALAAPVDIVEERIIGPSLGASNVESGLQAVFWSFMLVMVFFVVYYKTFGVVTNIALLFNLLLVVAAMSVLDATLSLPGLAGIALTVGMSVDANVLINERIREELRNGNSPLASIAAGYDKASGTIADANVTALLGGIAMAVFGSGPIRGFGITLIIGILTSMYTAVSVSRGIATLIYGRRKKLAAVSI